MTSTIDIPREVESLAQALAAPMLPKWATTLDRFSAATKQYAEYQISLASGELALVTLGRGAAHLDLIGAYMDGLPAGPAAAALFKSMRRYAGAATWGLKAALTHAPELQLYVKKPLPLAEVLFWLAGQGVPETARAQIETAGAHLEKSYTHFLGADFSPGRPAAFQVYFTQYVEPDGLAAGRLSQVIAALGLSDTAQAAFATYHPLLASAGQTVWLSLSVVNGALLPTVKLDYSGVRLGLAALVLENAAGAATATVETEAALDRLTLLRDTLGIPQANYFGLRLGGDDLRASVYLTRVSRGGQ